MPHKLAIDFGTTNSVIAQWNDAADAAEVVSLPGLSQIELDSRPPLIPSLVYVRDGQSGEVTVGQAVRDEKLDYEQSNRLFRNFKRGIVASPAPPPRRIDHSLWADRDAGRFFLRRLFQSLPYNTEVRRWAGRFRRPGRPKRGPDCSLE